MYVSIFLHEYASCFLQRWYRNFTGHRLRLFSKASFVTRYTRNLIISADSIQVAAIFQIGASEKRGSDPYYFRCISVRKFCRHFPDQ